MPYYQVDGWHRQPVMLLVEADSKEEALEKAKAGEIMDMDSEPGMQNCDEKRWSVKFGPSETPPGNFA